MSVMDGYEAPRLLRAQGYETAVIAMTANAMKGDEERCLAAGMNAYISKPLKPEALSRMINEWIDGKRSSKDAMVAASKDNHSPMLDHSTVISLHGALGDELHALFEEFFTIIPRDLSELENMYVVDDFAGMQRLAHRIKGSSGNIGLSSISSSCAALESISRDIENIDEIRMLMDDIVRAVDEAQQAIANGALEDAIK